MAKEYDPYMHTAEHILNQTMVRMLGCGRCFSSHLNSKKSKCDYKFTRDLTEQEAAQIEQKVNEILASNVPVTEEIMPLEQAANLVDVSRLPEGASQGGMVRIVRIGDYDICPCIGEHVQHTQESGAFRLISHSYTEPENNEQSMGILRLRFSLSRPTS